MSRTRSHRERARLAGAGTLLALSFAACSTIGAPLFTTKLAPAAAEAALDRKVGSPVTASNWRTVQALAAMVRERG